MGKRTDKKDNIKIGIIGKGFVGSAVAHGFSHQTSYGANIKIYDSNPERSQNSLDETGDAEARGIPGALANQPPLKPDLKQKAPGAKGAGGNIKSRRVRRYREKNSYSP